MKYSAINCTHLPLRVIGRHSAALFFLGSLFFALSACSIHQLDVQQGNVITNDMTEKLKIGMDKGQVRFIMGTPLISDPFHKNRWDYVFSLDAENGKKESTHLTVMFENNKAIKFNGAVTNAFNEVTPLESPVEKIIPPKVTTVLQPIESQTMSQPLSQPLSQPMPQPKSLPVSLPIPQSTEQKEKDL